jgi:hypothetical protein
VFVLSAMQGCNCQYSLNAPERVSFVCKLLPPTKYQPGLEIKIGSEWSDPSRALWSHKSSVSTSNHLLGRQITHLVYILVWRVVEC